jgi:hypothetical protein
MSDEQMVVLPAKVFNQITDFLLQQPYAQVSGLVEAIKETAQAVQPPVEKESVDSESDE